MGSIAVAEVIRTAESALGAGLAGGSVDAELARQALAPLGALGD